MPELRPTTFAIAGTEQSYPGWTSGRTWNGWACPLFEADVARSISSDHDAQQPAEEGPFRSWFDEEADAWVFDDPFSSESVAFYSVEQEGRLLYPIGADAWTWVEVGAAPRGEGTG